MASEDEIAADLEHIAKRTEELLTDKSLTPDETKRLLDDFLESLGSEPAKLETALKRLEQETQSMMDEREENDGNE